jgi:hypothetical protein
VPRSTVNLYCFRLREAVTDGLLSKELGGAEAPPWQRALQLRALHYSLLFLGRPELDRRASTSNQAQTPDDDLAGLTSILVVTILIIEFLAAMWIRRIVFSAMLFGSMSAIFGLATLPICYMNQCGSERLELSRRTGLGSAGRTGLQRMYRPARRNVFVAAAVQQGDAGTSPMAGSSVLGLSRLIFSVG